MQSSGFMRPEVVTKDGTTDTRGRVNMDKLTDLTEFCWLVVLL